MNPEEDPQPRMYSLSRVNVVITISENAAGMFNHPVIKHNVQVYQPVIYVVIVGIDC